MIEEIINKFKNFINEQQITQEYAAKQLSITQEHLSRIINGKRNPSTTLLIRMEKYMEGSKWAKKLFTIEFIQDV